ncbi:synaptobrevin [Toxoplasma gondii TgCatPRC2]|uniref:Synaptobrevin n=1 Tax=Toxoplasma gondii TgCatPRC2 TaxID=1130821 RepID=A0A151HGA0_TOXGO|nr:synaptobrevin [Toxoplasma gondii TgCatPRC2]
MRRLSCTPRSREGTCDREKSACFPHVSGASDRESSSLFSSLSSLTPASLFGGAALTQPSSPCSPPLTQKPATRSPLSSSSASSSPFPASPSLRCFAVFDLTANGTDKKAVAWRLGRAQRPAVEGVLHRLAATYQARLSAPSSLEDFDEVRRRLCRQQLRWEPGTVFCMLQDGASGDSSLPPQLVSETKQASPWRMRLCVAVTDSRRFPARVAYELLQLVHQEVETLERESGARHEPKERLEKERLDERGGEDEEGSSRLRCCSGGSCGERGVSSRSNSSWSSGEKQRLTERSRAPAARESDTNGTRSRDSRQKKVRRALENFLHLLLILPDPQLLCHLRLQLSSSPPPRDSSDPGALRLRPTLSPATSCDDREDALRASSPALRSAPGPADPGDSGRKELPSSSSSASSSSSSPSSSSSSSSPIPSLPVRFLCRSRSSAVKPSCDAASSPVPSASSASSSPRTSTRSSCPAAPSIALPQLATVAARVESLNILLEDNLRLLYSSSASLDALEQKTSSLSGHTRVFASTSRRVRRIMWVKSKMLYCLVAGAVVFVVFVAWVL